MARVFSRGAHNRQYSPLKAIHVDRTVELPQHNFESLLTTMGKRLDRPVKIWVASSTHLTFLESRGVYLAMRRLQKGPKEMQSFSYGLSNKIDDYRIKGIKVAVDTNKPLAVIGNNHDKLAINIVKDEQLQAERLRIEDIAKSEFGENLPPLKGFAPHITIGRMVVAGSLPIELKMPPDELFANFAIPETIALNGMRVYLNGEVLKH